MAVSECHTIPFPPVYFKNFTNFRCFSLSIKTMSIYIHVYTLLIVFPKLEIDISVSFSVRMSVVSCNLV